MRYKNILLLVVFVVIITIFGTKIISYYTPARHRSPYQTTQHHDDTIRIAYIGDSWAFGHQFHQCKIKDILEKDLHCPVIVRSYGIGGLTSKEIYHAIFDLDSLRHFMEYGYDYCYISAGINDTYKKMSTSYYKQSMDCIIQFLLVNNINPVIQEIPDYNIQRAFERQTTKRKLIRRISMIVNSSDFDCKKQFRNALNELIQTKMYQTKVSIIRYKSWNKSYTKDLKELYIEDQMHLNEKGYSVLDSAIAKDIIANIQPYFQKHIRINH